MASYQQQLQPGNQPPPTQRGPSPFQPHQPLQRGPSPLPPHQQSLQHGNQLPPQRGPSPFPPQQSSQPGNQLPPQRGHSPFPPHPPQPQRGPSPLPPHQLHHPHPPMQRGTSPFQPSVVQSSSSPAQPNGTGSPLLTPPQLSSRPASPASVTESSNRKQRRHYPQAMPSGQSNVGPPLMNPLPQQHQQQNHHSHLQPQQPGPTLLSSPLPQQPSMPNQQQTTQQAYPYASCSASGNNTPYPNSYQDFNAGMANMSLQQTPPTEQVALVGQSPLIQDLDRLIIPSNLPSNVRQ